MGDSPDHSALIPDNSSPSNEHVSLISYGGQTYLDNVIQALSSCSFFVLRLQKLEKDNKKLVKLNLLNKLIKTANGYNNDEIDLLDNFVFLGWNTLDNPDCFDLLSVIINDVYEERKHVMNVKSERLPLRIPMKFVYSCTCGYQELGPLQYEPSISIQSRIHPQTSVQSLVDKYFGEDKIDCCVCGNKGCTEGVHCRKLSLPLPETLCIHITREVFSDRVQICSELIIKRQFCGTDPGNDIVYFLKSAILDKNRGCFKKNNSDWYRIKGKAASISDEGSLLAHQANLLFYELREIKDPLSNINLSLIDYGISGVLHSVVVSLSSCATFVTWLEGVGRDSDSVTTAALKCLMALSANNDDDDGLGIDISKIAALNELDPSDSHRLMMKILEGVTDENDGDTQEPPPWRLSLSSLITCDCESKILADSEQESSFEATLTAGLSSTSVQEALDSLFEEKTQGRCCSNTLCTLKHSTRRLVLHHPLPKILCVQLGSGLAFTEELIVRGHYFTISERGPKRPVLNQCYTYHLRSVIASGGGSCYRRNGNRWFSVNSGSSATEEGDVVLSCDACVLLYEQDGLVEESRGSVDNGGCSETSLVPSSGTCLIRIVQSLSSCLKFVDWLNILNSDVARVEIRTIASLINVVNKNVMEDDECNDAVFQRWKSDVRSDIYEVMKTVLGGVIDEFDRGGSKEQLSRPIRIYNCTAVSMGDFQSSFITDLLISGTPSPDADPVTLQALLDRYLEIWLGYNTLHIKDGEDIPLDEALPDTIGFHLDESLPRDLRSGLAPSLSVLVKNKSCSTSRACRSSGGSCCRQYVLRSFVAVDGFCYRSVNGTFYRTAEGRCVTVEEVDMVEVRPLLMFYER